MCGIAGIFFYRRRGEEAGAGSLAAMTDSLAHRGPDGRGIWFSSDRMLGLGHRRLSILDLSSAGSQPMVSPDGRLAVVYNGEIYNFRRIRRELEALGFQFRSQTDTEVLLHGYAAWGKSLLERLNGMFAFALWDDAIGRLWLVRDRMGIKPLFYYDDGSMFLFGSEVKAILAHPGVPRRPDHGALHQFLTLNYVAAPATGFSGIRQLLPAEEMEVRRGNAPIRSKYWEIPFREEPLDISLDEAVEELDHRLGEAVRLRLVSDVPIGAFLSGGVDSSSVVRAMKKWIPDDVRTFSIGFEEESYDELRAAESVAKILGVSHRGLRLQPSVADLLPAIMRHHEEPTADSSSIAVCLLSAMTRQHVTVALSGDGADELLAGYETYRASLLASRYRRIPRWIRRCLIEPAVRALPVSHRRYSLESKAKRFVYGASQEDYPPHCCWRVLCWPQLASRLYSPEFRRKSLESSPLAEYASAMNGPPKGLGPLAPLLAADARFYLPNDMLVKVDRMSMAFGLEVRVPFLDHNFVSFCFSLPRHLMIGNGAQGKFLLKHSLRKTLPAAIVERPKAGFNLPLGFWMNQEFLPLLDRHLSRGMIGRMGLLEPGEVERIIEEHKSRRYDHGHLLYGLLCLSLWWQIWIERSLQPPPLREALAGEAGGRVS